MAAWQDDVEKAKAGVRRIERRPAGDERANELSKGEARE